MRFCQPLSIVFFYLGAGNTILARVAGTCTQGDADRLFGVVLSVAFYSIALLGLWLSRSARTIVLFSLPVLPILVWQLWFSFRLSFEILAQGRSACSVLEGAVSPYPNSGAELFFAMTWLIMSLGALLGIFFVLRARYTFGQFLQ